MKEKLKQMLNRIDELQQIIDTEQYDADAGCDWSRSLIINAEIEKEKIEKNLAAFALFFAIFSK